MFMSPFLIPILAILGGFAVIITQTVVRGRIRELEIRQRIAMIEKGLVPPPEIDPQGFDRAMARFEPFGGHPRSGGRTRRVGILLIGTGLGLMLLIGIAGESPNAAVGVGGFVATLGAAFLAIGRLERPSPVRDSSTPSISQTPQNPS